MNNEKPLSEIFVVLEELKGDHTNIEDYIISEITSEDIFLAIA
jgi:hypothetical protein